MDAMMLVLSSERLLADHADILEQCILEIDKYSVISTYHTLPIWKASGVLSCSLFVACLLKDRFNFFMNVGMNFN